MKRTGGLLLEALLALVIMSMMLALFGAQLAGGLKMIQQGELQSRASALADRMLALLELDQQTMQRVFGDQQQEGDFGDEYPGYFWRISLEPTEVPGLGQVRLDVLYNDKPADARDIRSATVVSTYAMLKADPGKIDLQQDFGLSGAQFEAVSQLLPTVGLDPNALDPQQLASLSPEILLTLLPQLLPLLSQFLGGQGLQGSGAGGEFTMQDLLALQDQLQTGQPPGNLDLNGDGTPDGPPGGADGGPPRGSGPNGEWTIEDLLQFQEQMTGQRGPGGAGDTPKQPTPRGPGRGPGRTPAVPGTTATPAGGTPNTPAGGTGPDGEWTLEDLLNLQEQMTGERGAAGAQPPGGGGRGGAPGAPGPGAGQRPAPGRNPSAPPRSPTPPAGGEPPIVQPSGVDENGNPQYTIEDLLRLRDELMRRGEGGGNP